MVTKLFGLWKSFPSWIKWPLAIIVAPNLIINTVIFFFWGVPWVNSEINAKIVPIQEKRDIEIRSIVSEQHLQYETVKGTLQRIEQHQAIMYQALLNKN